MNDLPDTSAGRDGDGSRGPEAPGEPPRAHAPGEEVPEGGLRRALPVYALTLLVFPLSAWLSAMLLAVPVVALVVRRVMKGEVAGVDFGLEAQQQLAALVGSGVAAMVAGVLANSLTFACTALIVAARTRVPPALARDALSAPERSILARRLRLLPASPRDVALSVLGLLGLTSALDGVVTLVGLEDFGSLAQMRAVLASSSLGEQLLLSLVVALGAGLAEELFFRGYLLSVLERRQGRRVAFVASSLLFGIFHLDPVHSPVSAAMGFYLASVVLTTGSLWPAVFAHVVNNLLAILTASLTMPSAVSFALIPLGAALALAALRVLRRGHPGERHPAVW